MRISASGATRLVLSLLAAVAAAFALVGSAQAAKSKRGVTFVLLSGPFAGELIRTDGGPNVPARLNGGLIAGKLIPQSEGHEFTFKGSVRTRHGVNALAAANTDAAALPEKALPHVVFLVAEAIRNEEGLARQIETSTPSISNPGALSYISDAKTELAALNASGQLVDPTYSNLVANLDKAEALDKAAAKNGNDAHKEPFGSTRKNKLKKMAVADLKQATTYKRPVVTTLTDLATIAAVFPAEPPPTPVAQPPVAAPGPLAAINGSSNLFGGTLNPGNPGSQGFVIDINGHVIPVGGPFQPSAINAFGPGGVVGGEAQGVPAFSSPPFVDHDPWTVLPEGSGGTGGAVRGGDEEWLVGFVSLTGGPPGEEGAAWVAKRGTHDFHGYRVKGFAGGSSLFTVSGNTAFGDHFDHGTSGTYRPFSIDLHTGVRKELFRPQGGSAQPRASDSTGLAAGASVFSNGALQATYWWSAQHYLRFGQGTNLNSINDAGVGVGIVDFPANSHAALFEHGKVYDLNTLIPSGSGWTLTTANAISDSGIVVGAGVLNGQQRGFILDLSSKRP